MAAKPAASTPLADELGKRIAADRREKNMTQNDLAERLGLSQGAVGRWESGDNYPALANLKRLRTILGWDRDTYLRYALRGEDAA